MSEVIKAGHEVVLPVGSAHIEGLVDGLNKRGIATSVMDKDNIPPRGKGAGFIERVEQVASPHTLGI